MITSSLSAHANALSSNAIYTESAVYFVLPLR